MSRGIPPVVQLKIRSATTHGRFSHLIIPFVANCLLCTDQSLQPSHALAKTYMCHVLSAYMGTITALLSARWSCPGGETGVSLCPWRLHLIAHKRIVASKRKTLRILFFILIGLFLSGSRSAVGLLLLLAVCLCYPFSAVAGSSRLTVSNHGCIDEAKGKNPR